MADLVVVLVGLLDFEIERRMTCASLAQSPSISCVQKPMEPLRRLDGYCGSVFVECVNATSVLGITFDFKYADFSQFYLQPL